MIIEINVEHEENESKHRWAESVAQATDASDDSLSDTYRRD